MLNEFIRQQGVSGNEATVRELIKQKLTGICDGITEDGMGNLIVKKKGRGGGAPVLLAVYMDEPGIIITKITEDGYLKFDKVGRIDAKQLLFRRVNIHGIEGVIALKAVHLSTKEEREKPVKTEQLLVDIGADSKKEAEDTVTVGDYGMIESEPVSFGTNKLKGKALGGRIGCFVALELLKEQHYPDLEVVFASQREIGARGMLTACTQCIAKKAVVIDSCEETDTVVIGSNSSGSAIHRMEKLATKDGIAIAKAVLQRGQDVPLRKSGRIEEILCLGIPVSHLHSATEVVNTEYVKSLTRLVKLYLNGGLA